MVNSINQVKCQLTVFANSSGDATARLWQVPAEGNDVPEPIVLNHLPNLNDNKDVTTLDWNPSGTLLATGSYDGQARIWTPRGELRCVMTQHRGPIFSLKWNKKGDLLLSGSADNTTVVWNPETGDMKQQFELHSRKFSTIEDHSVPYCTRLTNDDYSCNFGCGLDG
jgi:transducin (beta)-like 1